MSQQSPYRITSLSDFRRNTTQEIAQMVRMGGRLWITKHGKPMAAVVPMHQCELLERFEDRSLEQVRQRLERDYARWKAVKARDPNSVEPFTWELEGDF